MRIPGLNLREIVDAIRQLAMGGTSSGGFLTLATGATTTTVDAPTCQPASMIVLSPRSDTAAAAAPWVSATSNGSFTLTHAAAGAAALVDYEIRQRG